MNDLAEVIRGIKLLVMTYQSSHWSWQWLCHETFETQYKAYETQADSIMKELNWHYMTNINGDIVEMRKEIVTKLDAGIVTMTDLINKRHDDLSASVSAHHREQLGQHEILHAAVKDIKQTFVEHWKKTDGEIEKLQSNQEVIIAKQDNIQSHLIKMSKKQKWHYQGFLIS